MRLQNSGSLVFKVVAMAIVATLSACAYVPTSGPSAQAIVDRGSATKSSMDRIKVVDIDGANGGFTRSKRVLPRFSEEFPARSLDRLKIGPGDALEVTIWEAAPAALFGDISTVSTSSRTTVLPEQIVDRSGDVVVPFVGPVQAAGRTITELQADIVRKLTGRANHPQVIARLTHNSSAYVTVIGDVKSTVRMPLSPSGEHLLDALADAGGTTQPVDKTTIQLTRRGQVHSMPLQSIIRDPAQNIVLVPGDVVTAVFQPLSFTVLGATGKNDEVNFEAQGISLAQALARSGGAIDNRADAQGVFIFRFENAHAIAGSSTEVGFDDLVPVVYRLNLRNPESLFAAQEFQMQNRDILYVSNAPVAELQKFMNLIFTAAFPIVNSVRAFQ
uniref:polysaccharide biosynthesis/export family protein n=1 Tax=Caballeronia sp. LjRoot34 TaxID=3342325 RepID=UPI003F4F9856